ncbi:MAG: dihydrodipicolinate synthase family protein [Candidatus Binatia bacterium]
MKPKFRGIFIPLLTTFTEDGEVDFKTVGELTEFEINAGVHGLFVLGSTGMGPVMTTKQRIDTAEFVVKQVKGRIPIIMHVGTADLQTTVELARHADGLGVDAVAVVPPFYYTDHTPWEISAHYKAVAGVIKCPLFLYDNVNYSGFRFTPASVKKLASEVPSLCGMKASYYPQAQLLEYLDVMPEDFAVMSGNTIDLLPAAPHGLSGAIPPPTSHVPELIVALWNAIESKKYAEAVALQKKADDFGRTIARLGARFGRSAHREALRLRGFKVKRYPRWPSEELTEEAIGTLAAALRATGV